MKTTYVTIKGIEVMLAQFKSQSSSFYYGKTLSEMRRVRRIFEI